MKAKLSATKLENADVSHISLVPRGANRAPFKIVKNHKGDSMIQLDLSRIFKDGDKKTQKQAGPEVLGFVIQQDDNTETVRKALAEAGAKVEAVKEFADGTVLFAQQEVTEDAIKDAAVFKASDDFAIVVKGFDPYALTEGTSFGEILKAQGFMPGFHMATEALFQTVRNSLVTAKDQKEAVSSIQGALKEFADYTGGLAGAIPMSAFKAGEAFRLAKAEHAKVVKATEAALADEKAKKDEADRVAKEAADKAAADAAAAAAVKKEEPKQDAKKEDEPKGPDVAKLIGDAIVKASADSANHVANAVKPLGEALVALKATVDAVSKDLDQVKKDAKEAKTVADANDKVLKGAVIGGEPEDDKLASKKSDTDAGESMGVIDTAFNRNIRKTDAARAASRKNHLL